MVTAVIASIARTAAMNGPAARPPPGSGKPTPEEMKTSLHRRTSMHVIQMI